MRNASRLISSLLLMATSACNCGVEEIEAIPEPDPIPPTATTGAVEGRVCAGDGETWLVGATISVEKPGADGGVERISTTSDDEGRFRLEGAPLGDQTVLIEKESFTTTRDVTVEPGLTVVIADDDCRVGAPRIAISLGRSQYDRVQDVLAELGFVVPQEDRYGDDWAERLLSTDDGLEAYDILFLNCRSFEDTFIAQPEMQERLRAFVARGGSLYASDQSYGLIEATFPDAINFLGDDSVARDANQGADGSYNTRVLDGVLAAQLASDSIEVVFNQNTWSVMAGVDASVDVYLQSDVVLLDDSEIRDAPMMVGFTHGEGRVIYSSFHEEGEGTSDGQKQVLKLIMFEL